MAYILEKIGNTYNLPKKYFTCDAKSDLDGISLVDVPIGSEAYCILEEESYILDSNKQWHKKKIGEDLTGQVQADLSQTDSTQADYVKGVIRQESLPEGYPYKESRVTVDLKPIIGADIVLCKVSDNTPEPLPVGSYVQMWLDGENVGEHSVSSASGSHFVVNQNMVFVVYENNYSMNGAVFPEKGVYFMRNNSANFAITGVAWDRNATEPDITWDGVVETIHPMAPEFLPELTLTSPNGTKYKLTVSDDGTLSAVAVS